METTQVSFSHSLRENSMGEARKDSCQLRLESSMKAYFKRKTTRATRISHLVCLAVLLATANVRAEQNDPERAPMGRVIKPGDLLKEPDSLELRFGYLPSVGKLRLLALCVPVGYTRWEARVSKPPSDVALYQWQGPLPFPKAGVTVDAPALAEGVYGLEVVMVSSDGEHLEIHRTFERKRFSWEGNPAGRDRLVIPPFTPLKTDEESRTVSCVLRLHELADTGLWDQVSSKNRPLLESHMRLEIEAAGKTHTARGAELNFSERAPDRVRGGAVWSAGPVRGRTSFDFDYDGLVKITLQLQPANVRVDRMQLVIPMRTDEASLMHPVTDLLRFHYAGRIPDGKGRLWDYGGNLKQVRYTETGRPDSRGKVWDSRHVGRWQLPGPFVPYIWLGGPERGICWFAENDRDWSLDPAKPCLEIRRNDAVTSLVVHLVNKPVLLKRSRTLVFGLMATPAKPMPENPVHFRRWWTGAPHENTKDVVGVGYMGACYYWGAPGPCYAFYPAFKNFSIFEEFARLRNGGARDVGFTKKWLTQFVDPGFAPHMETYRAHVNWSVNFFAGDPWRRPTGDGQIRYVIPYTNARAINWGEEARTFMDEWSNIDIADPRWPGEERFIRDRHGGYRLATYGKVREPDDTTGVAYAVDPVSSWQDMVLHYHKRMLDTFADGIYFDNYFLVPNYSPLGPGYVDDDGDLRPGVNIFAFHDLTKRVAVMQHRMGRRPLIFIHMTNANIVPVLSFGTLLLDHEWRDRGDFQEKDFHERLYLDNDDGLLQAQSTGLQSGCIGVIHNLLRGETQVRSALGVALVHEMKLSVNTETLVRNTARHLCELGYGLSDCRVWRYWDDPQPIQVSGVPVKTLTLTRAGRAMIVVSSFGPAGKVKLNLDRKMLALAGDIVAVNAETGQQLVQSDRDSFTLIVPRHDFRLVQITPVSAQK
jgi:hypothetical protein